MKDQLIMVMEEKRKGSRKPVPENLEQFLNEHQLAAVENVERFGCTLRFVRRSKSDKAIPVLEGPDGRKVAVVEESGNIIWEPKINVRK